MTIVEGWALRANSFDFGKDEVDEKMHWGSNDYAFGFSSFSCFAPANAILKRELAEGFIEQAQEVLILAWKRVRALEV